MINIFVIGEVYDLDRFDNIQSYYSTVKDVTFYYCLSGYFRNDLPNCIIIQKQKSIYDYIKPIINKYKFNENDEIFINVVGNVLFLKDKEFYKYENVDCFVGRNYLNILSTDQCDKVISYEEIMKQGLEIFINTYQKIIITDDVINGCYFKYKLLKEFIDSLKINILEACLGEDLIIFNFIEKNTKYKMMNGFTYINEEIKENNNDTSLEYADHIKQISLNIAESSKLCKQSIEYWDELDKIWNAYIANIISLDEYDKRKSEIMIKVEMNKKQIEENHNNFPKL